MCTEDGFWLGVLELTLLLASYPLEGSNMQKQTHRAFTSLLKIAGTLLLLLPLTLATPARAYGYADPGTGAFIYQAAYAAFLGGTFYLRKLLDRLWRRRTQSISSDLPPVSQCD
jgi:hypothetical protein